MSGVKIADVRRGRASLLAAMGLIMEHGQVPMPGARRAAHLEEKPTPLVNYKGQTINLETEAALIEAKKSRWSRSEREYITNLHRGYVLALNRWKKL